MQPDSNFIKALFEVSHIEIQAYNLDKHCLIFSSGLAEKILGYTSEQYKQFSNNFYQELIHPEDREIARTAVERLARSVEDQIVELTVRVRRMDGTFVWIYSRQMVLERNKRGEPSKIIRVAEDITPIIKLEDQLEEKVAALKKISYTNSHLLRGPVASIIGLIGLIEEHNITSDHNRQVFTYMKTTIEKLDGVIMEINENTKL